jgi:hypothetical protein
MRCSSAAPSSMTISALPPNIPNVDVLPVQGINVYDILRRKAGPVQGCGRCSGGALQMTDLRHYDVIVSPVITEKSTLVSEQNQVSSMSPATLPSLKSRLLSKRCSVSR